MALAKVELHPERIVDLRCDRVRLCVLCAFIFLIFPQLQQNRERLHFRFTDGFVRIDPELLAFV